jgi:integrase
MRGRRRLAATDTAPSRYRGSDGRWHARVTTGSGLDGRPIRKHLSRATKTELDRAVRELERSRDSGTGSWTTSDSTLQQWMEHWLEAILPSTVRWKTLSTYRSQVRLHVIPHLGPARLSELRPETLEELYRRLLDAGSSAHVVHAVHRVLRSALNEAVRRQRLAVNPALIARPPRVAVVEVQPLTTDECRAVLRAAVSGPDAARWSVALALGLRQGEALGLKWSDVDWDAGTLTVRRAVQRPTWSTVALPGVQPTRRPAADAAPLTGEAERDPDPLGWCRTGWERWGGFSGWWHRLRLVAAESGPLWECAPPVDAFWPLSSDQLHRRIIHQRSSRGCKTQSLQPGSGSAPAGVGGP